MITARTEVRLRLAEGDQGRDFGAGLRLDGVVAIPCEPGRKLVGHSVFSTSPTKHVIADE